MHSNFDAAGAMRAVRRTAGGHDWRSTLARGGLTAKGVLYAVLGVLALQVAAGNAPTGSASTRDAIEMVASQPQGQWLLAILTAGLFALALWQALLVFAGDPVEGTDAKHKVKYALKAAVYLGIASTALALLAPRWGSAGSSGGNGGAERSEQAAAVVLNWPGGQWLVALGGLALMGVAIHQIHAHAWHRRFLNRLALGRTGPAVASWIERAGRAGYAARGVVLIITGLFLVVAAVQHDPQEAVGLSGVLAVMARQPWGSLLLWLVAIGLFLYGCFCFAEARYRRAT